MKNRIQRPAQHDQPLEPRNGGQALSSDEREALEPRFNHSLANIRIYPDDPRAAAFDAHAYAVGSQIGFRSGAYQPDTPQGLQVLAHEIAHVVQNERFGPVKEGRISQHDDASERDAHRAASNVMAGGMASVSSAPSASVARITENELGPLPPVAPAQPWNADMMTELRAMAPAARTPAARPVAAQAPHAPQPREQLLSMLGLTRADVQRPSDTPNIPALNADQLTSLPAAELQSIRRNDQPMRIVPGTGISPRPIDEQERSMYFQRERSGTRAAISGGVYHAEDSAGNATDVLNASGEVGVVNNGTRVGLRAGANVLNSVQGAGDPSGLETSVGTAGLEASIGDDGATLGYGASVGGVGVRAGGNLDPHTTDNLQARANLSYGPSTGVRARWSDNDHDGLREIGFGAEVGPLSFDVSSELPHRLINTVAPPPLPAVRSQPAPIATDPHPALHSRSDGTTGGHSSTPAPANRSEPNWMLEMSRRLRQPEP